ncbi:GtrA family protein [Streptomyces sp. NPDC091209]|uniref:GtrA family protein n=1 Tax=Streptomyces sp. NPDC091209 TaxID=3365974 RepID=UPI0037FC2D15
MRFTGVGGVGVVVNFAVFNLCRSLTPLPVVRCSVIGTSVAVLRQLPGLRYFAYRDRDKRRPASEFTLFVVCSIIGLAIENGVLYATTYWFGWDTALQTNLFKAVGHGCARLSCSRGRSPNGCRVGDWRPRSSQRPPPGTGIIVGGLIAVASMLVLRRWSASLARWLAARRVGAFLVMPS